MDQFEEYRKAFDYGWVREVVFRQTGNRCDIYYKLGLNRVRSSKELMAYLEKYDICLTQDNFNWKCQPLGIGEPLEIIKSMKKPSDMEGSSSSAVEKNKEAEEKRFKKRRHEKSPDFNENEATLELNKSIDNSLPFENEPHSAELVKNPKTKSKKSVVKGKVNLRSAEEKSVVPESPVISEPQTSGIVEKPRTKGKKKSQRKGQNSDKDNEQLDSTDRDCDVSSDIPLLTSKVNDNVQKRTVDNIMPMEEPTSTVDNSDTNSEVQQNHDDIFPIKGKQKLASAIRSSEEYECKDLQETRLPIYRATKADMEEKLGELEMKMEPKQPKNQKGEKSINLMLVHKSLQSFANAESSDVQKVEISDSQNGNVEDVLGGQEIMSTNKASRKRKMPQSPVVKKAEHKTQEQHSFQMQKGTKKLRSSNIPSASSSTVSTRTETEPGPSIQSNTVNTLFMKPFDLGWRREVVYRKNQKKLNECDIYYHSPEMKKFRSSVQISKHVSGNELTVDNFCFVKRPLGLPEALEIVRRAK